VRSLVRIQPELSPQVARIAPQTAWTSDLCGAMRGYSRASVTQIVTQARRVRHTSRARAARVPLPRPPNADRPVTLSAHSADRERTDDQARKGELGRDVRGRGCDRGIGLRELESGIPSSEAAERSTDIAAASEAASREPHLSDVPAGAPYDRPHVVAVPFTFRSGSGVARVRLRRPGDVVIEASPGPDPPVDPGSCLAYVRIVAVPVQNIGSGPAQITAASVGGISLMPTSWQSRQTVDVAPGQTRVLAATTDDIMPIRGFCPAVSEPAGELDVKVTYRGLQGGKPKILTLTVFRLSPAAVGPAAP
jgi:hypothetical protein